MGRGTRRTHSATGGVQEQGKHLSRVTPETHNPPLFWAAPIIFYLRAVSIFHNLKKLVGFSFPTPFGNTPPHCPIYPFPTQLSSAVGWDEAPRAVPGEAAGAGVRVTGWKRMLLPDRKKFPKAGM